MLNKKLRPHLEQKCPCVVLCVFVGVYAWVHSRMYIWVGIVKFDLTAGEAIYHCNLFATGLYYHHYIRNYMMLMKPLVIQWQLIKLPDNKEGISCASMSLLIRDT